MTNSMNNSRSVCLLFLFFISQFASAQKNKSPKLSKADKVVVSNLQKHIHYLADDKLEGRRAGTNGEKLAQEYISNEFQQIGIQPRGSDGFFQPFDL